MKKLVRAITFEPKDHPGEKNDLPSLTVPDQSFTIAEILEKHTQGIPLGILKQGSYSGTEDFDDFDETRRPDFDLVDAQDLTEQIGQVVESEEVDTAKNEELETKSKQKQKTEDEQ